MNTAQFGPEPLGATPLDDAERLLLPGITTRGALNAVEQANILEARRWCFRRRRPVDQVIGDGFLRELHRRMFDSVWSWAGENRKRDTSIGVPFERISVELRNASLDAKAWIAAPTWSWTELAVRWHLRLVWVHPFTNGNGRWSRLAADVLLHSLRQPDLTWGHASLDVDGSTRSRYMEAIRLADAGDFRDLVALAHS